MAILSASNVGQSFGEYDVFGGVNVSIPRDGKVGLVGPNGVGKTTLLLILAGRAAPSSGQVNVARGTRIGYLSQESSDAFIGQSAHHTVFEEMVAVFEPLRGMEARLRQMEAEMAGDATSDDLLEEYSRLLVQYEIAGGYDYETRVRMVLTGLCFRPDAWGQPLTQLSGG